jgi:hypothetical protein
MLAAMYNKWKSRTKKNPVSYLSVKTIDKTLPELTYPSIQSEEFHASGADIRGMFGGDRAGKSGPGCMETIIMMRRYPGTLHWCACQTQEKIPALWKWHQQFLAPWEIDGDPIYSNRGRDIVVEWKHINGSRLVYKTYKAGPASFDAEEVKSIHMDEDPCRVTPAGEKIYNDCCSRILTCNGRLWITATPVLGKNWMYQRLYLYNRNNRVDHDADPDIQRWTVSLEDNRTISDENKAKQLGRMAADEKNRRFYGAFDTLTGAVCKEWREELSVPSHHNTIGFQEFPLIPMSWRRIEAIDLGYEDPFCDLFVAEHDGALYFYDEYYQNQTLIKDHAAEILRRRLDLSLYTDLVGNVGLEDCICDHDRQERAELEEYGVWNSPAEKGAGSVALSIQILNRKMMPRADGRPSIYVSPRCVNLIEQFGSMVYKEVKPGQDSQEKLAAGADHAFDPARYATMYFFGDEIKNYGFESGAGATRQTWQK